MKDCSFHVVDDHRHTIRRPWELGPADHVASTVVREMKQKVSFTITRRIRYATGVIFDEVRRLLYA